MSETPLKPSELEEIAEGIFYSAKTFVVVDNEIVDFLKNEARNNNVGRARICTHPSAKAEQHDMLIASHCKTYVAPHRHISKSESFIVVEGRVDLLLFTEAGQLTDRIAMAPANAGLPFFYRMPNKLFHSLDITDEVVVFVESTKGPFRKEDMENASWAPPADDYHAGREFISSLRL